MKNQLFKICIFILLLFSCGLEPEKEYIYRDRIINVGEIIEDVPLQYSYTIMMNVPYKAIWFEDPEMVDGTLLWVIAQNISDQQWYGHPEIRVYTTDEPMKIGSTLTDYDLAVKENGILVTEIDYNYVPQEIVVFIPPREYRHGLAFAKTDYDALKQYVYVLWRFVPTGLLKTNSINSIRYDEIKWMGM